MVSYEHIERISTLIARFATGEARPEEQEELLAWRNGSPQNEALFQELTTADTLIPALATFQTTPEETAAAEENFYKIMQSIRTKRLVRKMYVATAAAVILFLAGAGYWYFSRPGTATNNKTIIAFDDVPAPTGNKIQLQLAGGETILLDDARNGNIAQQGPMQVVMKDGELSYQKTTVHTTVTQQYNTITTPKGSQFAIVLSDGTKVWLNAGSSIRFPVEFTGNERVVEVTGEAYFEVATDKTKFIVENGDTRVQVYGTAFNINGYDDEPEKKITLVEGRVTVTGTSSQESKILKPGQQAQLDQHGAIHIQNDVDIASAVAWKNREFNFTGNDNIKVVMRQIERWYNVDVIYNEEVEAFLRGQISRNKPLSEVLKLLQRTETVHFRIEGRKVFVRR